MARRKSSNKAPVTWFVAGLVTGLALATVYVLGSGHQAGPDGADGAPVSDTESSLISAEPEQADEPSERRPRYDFFTVLPEMEVVVPDEEISAQAEAPETSGDETAVDYILQAGSLYDLERLFAGVAILSLLGVLVSAAIGRIEARLLRWRG